MRSQLFILGVVVVLGLTVGVGRAEAQVRQADEVPLPSDLKIMAPDSSVPPELAKFSGRWGEGKDKWDEQLAHILVVERVDQKDAGIVYAYGTASQWWINTPGWIRLRGEFTDKNELVLKFRSGAVATYRFNGDKLESTYRSRRGFDYHITLHRSE